MRTFIVSTIALSAVFMPRTSITLRTIPRVVSGSPSFRRAPSFMRVDSPYSVV